MCIPQKFKGWRPAWLSEGYFRAKNGGGQQKQKDRSPINPLMTNGSLGKHSNHIPSTKTFKKKLKKN